MKLLEPRKILFFTDGNYIKEMAIKQKALIKRNVIVNISDFSIVLDIIMIKMYCAD